jgi:hypothetical protein
LAQKNIDLYDIHSRKRTSYESQKDIYNLINEIIDFDKLYYATGENGLILSSMDIPNNKFLNIYLKKENDDYIVKTKNSWYLLKSLEKNSVIGFYVYKPIKIKSYDKINLLWN